MPSTNDLIHAAAEGNLAKVRKLLAAGVDPNKRGGYLPSPLLTAAEAGHLEVCTALLDGGADPNLRGHNGNTALIAAVGHERELVVRLLIERGADVNLRGHMGRPPLLNAVNSGKTHLAQILLDAGADLFLKDDLGHDAVSEADASGLKRMQKFIRAIAEARSPAVELDLHQAAGHGLLDQVKQRLDQGIDVNRRDQHGRTALMEAAKRGQLAVIDVLLAAGADPQAASPKGHHALHDAAWADDPAVIRRLLDAGVPVDVTVPTGLTALMMAALLGKEQALRCLLEAGADPHRATDNGDSAATFAQSGGRKIQRLFKELIGAPPEAADAFYDDVKAFKTRAGEPAFVALAETLGRRCGHKLYPWKKRKGVFRYWIRDPKRLARELGLPEETARPELIERLQDEVRAAGCLLIVGNAIEPNPPLMLFPTSNQYAVILACGTNANRLVHENGVSGFEDAAYLAKWLHELAMAHPWRLLECGFDFLGGRFDLPVQDAAQLAERLIRFCPDILESEPGDVANELATTGRFFCWWD